MLLTVVLVSCSAVLFCMYWIQNWGRYARLLNKFPGPPVVPIIGNVLGFSTKTDVLFPQIRKMIGSYSETWRAWSGIYGSLHIVNADDAEIILSNAKYSDKSELYELLNPWLGTGLLTSSGAKWQHRRKILTPAFHFHILRRFIEVFGDHSDRLVVQLKEESKKSKTNIVPLITKLTLATICETAMGIQLDPKDKMQATYFESLYKIAPYIIQRVLLPWLHPDVVYSYTHLSRQFSNLINTLHAFTKKVIKAREANFKDSDVMDLEKEEEDDNGIVKKRLAMLDLLISAKKHRQEIDDEGIREEVDTFVFEGHDTTSAGVCFILLLLANHKNEQEKVIEELDQIFGESKRRATYDDLQSMKYLERCIKESLRLYPPVPLISRHLNEDTPLTYHLAPSQCMIFVHIFNIHRDPKIYPEPEKFDPERFTPEQCKGRNPFAYIPFSAGARNCIGQKFAMLELKSIVSSVLRNFRMEPIDTAEDITLVVDLVLRTKGPINIKFTPR